MRESKYYERIDIIAARYGHRKHKRPCPTENGTWFYLTLNTPSACSDVSYVWVHERDVFKEEQ